MVVSIIGADRFGGGYGAAKVAHEQALLSGPIPARVLRASQFHEFVAQLMEWGARGDTIELPEMRTQLVAARAVGQVLADLATANGAQSTQAPILEIAGPREERLVEAARLLAARRGDATPIQEVNDPADPSQAVFASGGLLPGPDAILAGPTFADWLDER